MCSDRRRASYGARSGHGARALFVAVLGFVLGHPLEVAPVRAAELGGHRLEISLAADRVDFDEEIRFEDDLGLSATVLAEVVPGAWLGLELARVGARDRERDLFQDVVTVAVRGRVEPFADARFSVGAMLGVSFLAFENQEAIDSASEGFELGPSLRWNVDADWRVRLDWYARVQTVSRPQVDESGLPTGDETETGYVWSSVLRLGVGIGF